MVRKVNKRNIYVIIIILILSAICVVEQILVNNYLSEMKTDVTEIVELAKNKIQINTPEIKQKVDALEQKWQGYETTLCFLVNLKDIDDLGIELTKMKVYVEENSVTEFNASLQLVLYHIDNYYSAMGINFENIF